MQRRQFLAGMPVAPAFIPHLGAASQRPNILWILGDDLGCELGCYGYQGVKTPNLDRLASQGARFTEFHTTAPVCSASRSAFQVGLYQTTTGTHHHRSHQKDGYRLPAPALPIMERMRQAGYFCANVIDAAPGVKGTGKTDFNFLYNKPFDGKHWRERPAGQPFFAQIHFQAPHKGPAFVEARRQKVLVDPAGVELPPYFPDHPVVRDEMANYLDAVQLLDWQVGQVLAELEREGLAQNTVVMLFGDNGRCLIRGKQWLYRTGTHVPFLLRWPGVVKAGSVRTEPATTLDLNATTLFAAGVAIPSPYHGRPLLGQAAKPREFVITARDRCGPAVDRIRCVRDGRYAYIRNFMPEKPYTQFSEYIETYYPTQKVMKELYAQGKLDAAASLFMAARKPEAEFYDLAADPHEVKNRIEEPAEQKRIAQYAARLAAWMKASGDRGAEVESEAARL
jgi:N-sulfoglucosamine sulfohydrolase